MNEQWHLSMHQEWKWSGFNFYLKTLRLQIFCPFSFTWLHLHIFIFKFLLFPLQLVVPKVLESYAQFFSLVKVCHHTRWPIHVELETLIEKKHLQSLIRAKENIGEQSATRFIKPTEGYGKGLSVMVRVYAIMHWGKNLVKAWMSIGHECCY